MYTHCIANRRSLAHDAKEMKVAKCRDEGEWRWRRGSGTGNEGGGKRDWRSLSLQSSSSPHYISIPYSSSSQWMQGQKSAE